MGAEPPISTHACTKSEGEAREINARGMEPDGLGVENRGLRQKLRALERELFSETLRRGRTARGSMVAGHGD